MLRQAAALIASPLLAASVFAAGDAEWQSGVNALNKAKREVNANSAELRKAGVNVNQLNQRISMAERQLMNARAEMLKANTSFYQNSVRSNILSQFDVFKSGSAFNSSLRLNPISNIVDMGMSNSFSANGTLLKSSSLYEVKPSLPFQPMRSAEEVLKANSSLSQPPRPAPALSLPIGLPPSSEASVASSSRLGVIDPRDLKASDPVYSLKVKPPPLPEAAPQAPPEPKTTGDFSVAKSDSTAGNDYVLLPDEGKQIKANASVFVEGDMPFAKGKASLGTGGVDVEGGLGVDSGEGNALSKFLNKAGVDKASWDGSGTHHWDWNGEKSTVWKTGPSVEIPITSLGWSNTSLSLGGGRSVSSKGETSDGVEIALSKGYKIPLSKKIEVKAGASLGFEWDAKDDPNAGASKLYGPVGSSFRK